MESERCMTHRTFGRTLVAFLRNLLTLLSSSRPMFMFMTPKAKHTAIVLGGAIALASGAYALGAQNGGGTASATASKSSSSSSAQPGPGFRHGGVRGREGFGPPPHPPAAKLRGSTTAPRPPPRQGKYETPPPLDPRGKPSRLPHTPPPPARGAGKAGPRPPFRRRQKVAGPRPPPGVPRAKAGGGAEEPPPAARRAPRARRYRQGAGREARRERHQGPEGVRGQPP